MIHLDWNAIPSCINSFGVPTLLCIPGIITNIIYWLLIFAGIVALFLIIFSGFKFINSGGDSKAVDSARKTFTYALLGLILIFGSFAIVSLVGRTFGVQNILQFNFGPLNLNSNAKTTGSPTVGSGNTTCKSTKTKTCVNLGALGGCKCVNIPAKDTTTECSPSCTTGKICRNVSGKSSCQFDCSNAHTNGWCPSSKECLKDNASGTFWCQARCKADQIGWCPGSSTCQGDPISGTFSCQTPQPDNQSPF